MSLNVNGYNPNFRGNETTQTAKVQQENTPVTNPANNSNTTPNSDKEKSNAMKYAIGATALAAVITLGILGRKGKLGKGIQKFLGGIETKAPETKAPEPKAPKTLARLKGEHYTGKLNIKLKDDNVVSLEYKDGLIQTAEKRNNKCIHVSSKIYKYDKDGNLIQILEKYPSETEIFSKKSIGNITRINTSNGFCIFEDNTLKYRQVFRSDTIAYDKNGKVVGTIIDYDKGTRSVCRYIYVTPDGTKFTYLLAPKHESGEAIKVLKSYVITDKTGRFYQLKKEKYLNDGRWSEPEYLYVQREKNNQKCNLNLAFSKDGKCIEKDDDMPLADAENMLTDIGKRIKDAHKKALKIIYDVEENNELFCPKKQKV